jgi:mRNA interferase MazF
MMRRHTVTYEPFDIIVVPFPFTDSAKTKRRPALVLSGKKDFSSIIEHTVLAMITSQKNAPWPLDVTINDIAESGLTAPSIVRMKLFTLDNRFIIRKSGSLSKNDQANVKKSLMKIFGYL